MYWLYAVQNGDVSVVRSTAIFGASAAGALTVSAPSAAAVSADRTKVRFVCMCCFLPNFFYAVFVRGPPQDGQAVAREPAGRAAPPWGAWVDFRADRHHRRPAGLSGSR